MTIGFPNGFWYNNNGTWNPTTLQNAELFTFANVAMDHAREFTSSGYGFVNSPGNWTV